MAIDQVKSEIERAQRVAPMLTDKADRDQLERYVADLLRAARSVGVRAA
jgi:hypothetical protein